MQSTRLLITAQRCSSASRINHLLRRCLTVSTPTTRATLNSSSQPLVDPSPSSYAPSGLLSLARPSVGTVRRHQPFRHASSGSFPSHKRITLPALSPTMETGTLRSWSKKEGDKVAEGDILAEIETDKATLGFESGDEGYLARILLPGGSKDIPVGQLCAIIVEKEEDIAAFKDYKDEGNESSAKKVPADQQAAAPEKPSKTDEAASKTEQPSASASKKETQQEKKITTAKSTSSGEGRVAASPLARKLAQEKGVEIDSVQGSGPNGRIVVEDVEKFLNDGGASAKSTSASKTGKDDRAAPSKSAKKDREVSRGSGGFNEQQVSDLQAENARRMIESKSTIPHYYLTIEIELDEILKLRQKINEMLTPKGKDSKTKASGLTMNDFIIKAAALACKKRPETNSIWMEKSIRQYETVDINVAVSSDAGVLMTPLVYNADQKGLSAISKELSELTERAKSGTLNSNETETGTFTISNLGMYGVTNFSAIIYPQQSAVLAIGGVETKLVPAPDSPKGFRSSTVLNVTLACDHRVIDGAVGAQWLQEFKQFLEHPGSMIL